ncbi:MULTISPECIES: hypothetical protein [Rhodococcus]|nr:hypothetical protein [Rhodococcus rhodochrous]
MRNLRLGNTRGAGPVAAAAALMLLAVGPASATPPVATPEPGGIIRMDLAPGETWECEGWSLEPPYLQVIPDFYKFETGPNPMFFRYTPGTRVFIQCIGTGAPYYYVGPVVTAIP